MSYPANAFQRCTSSGLLKGDFFSNGREWFLAVDYVGDRSGKISAIQVTDASGNDQGAMWVDIDPTQKFTRVASPYSTDIHSEVLPKSVGNFNRAPIILGSEPIIVGRLDGDEVLFTVSGSRRPDKADMMYATGFNHWELWVVKEGGSQVGDKPLFSTFTL